LFVSICVVLCVWLWFLGIRLSRIRCGWQGGKRIVDREDDYRKRRLNRIISPARNDAFAMGDKTPDARSVSSHLPSHAFIFFYRDITL
jgi:hypothetical protein